MIRKKDQEILQSIYTSVEQKLVNVLKSYFNVDKNTNKLQLLFISKTTVDQGQFPRYFEGYEEAVEMMVINGKVCPKTTISFLFSILPFTQPNILYNSLKRLISLPIDRVSMFDCFCVLFFCDCTAQLLSFDSNLDDYSPFITMIGKIHDLPSQKEYESIMKQIINQYAVVFSFISSQIPTHILNNFKGVLDPGVKTESKETSVIRALTVYKYIRLDMKFLDEIKGYFSILYDLAQKSQSSRIIEAWGIIMCNMYSQIKQITNDIEDITQKIFGFAHGRCSKKDSSKYMYKLCAIILVRDGNADRVIYKDFIQMLIEKAMKKHRATVVLTALLEILRGNSFSKTLAFWEWGNIKKCNAKGIDLSFINDNLPSGISVDSIFFVNPEKRIMQPLDSIEFWRNISILSDIFANFAARDFKFFSTKIVPIFSKNECYLPCIVLSECFSKLLDPEYQFIEWMSNTSEIRKIELEKSYKAVALGIKSHSISLFPSIPGLSETLKQPYCFVLENLNSPPEFHLPLFSNISQIFNHGFEMDSQKKSYIIDDKEFPLDKMEWFTLITMSVINLTEVEQYYISYIRSLMTLLDHSDFINDNIKYGLLKCILSSSFAISNYTINAVAYFYTINIKYRISILNMISSWLQVTKVASHLFFILLILRTLLSMSLSLKCSKCDLDDLLRVMVPTILVLICYPSPQIRYQIFEIFGLIEKYSCQPIIEFQLMNNKYLRNSFNYFVAQYQNNKVFKDPQIKDYGLGFQKVSFSCCEYLFRIYLSQVSQLWLYEGNEQTVCNFISLIVSILEQMNGKFFYENKDDDNNFVINLFVILLAMYRGVDNDVYDSIKNFQISGLSLLPYDCTDKLDKKGTNIIRDNNHEKTASLFQSLLKFGNNNRWNALVYNCYRFPGIFSLSPIFDKFFDNFNDLKTNQQTLEYVFNIQYFLYSSPDSYYIIMSNLKIKSVFIETVNYMKDFCGTKQIQKDLYPLVESYLKMCCSFFNSLVVDTGMSKYGVFRTSEPSLFLSNAQNYCESIRDFALCLIQNTQIPDYIQNYAYRVVGVLYSSVLSPNCVGKVLSLVHKSIIWCEENGWPTINYVLRRMDQSYADNLFDFCLKGNENNANIVLKGIYRLLVNDTSSYCGSSKSLINDTCNHMLNSKRDKIIIDESFSFNGENMSDYETKFNNFVVTNSRKIISLALVFLASNDYSIRSIAFGLLLRLVPFIVMVMQKNETRSYKESFNAIFKFSPLLGSSITSISYLIIRDIASEVSIQIPELSESVLRFMFSLYIGEHEKSFIYNYNQKAIIGIVSAFVGSLDLFPDYDSISIVPLAFAHYTPYNLIHNLILVSDRIPNNILMDYLGIWTQISNSKYSIVRVLNVLLDDVSETSIEIMKDIILSFNKNTYGEIVALLCSRLSFQYWCFSHYSFASSLPQVCPVIAVSFVEKLSVIVLSQIAQIDPSYMLHFSHVLMQYLFIYCDEIGRVAHDLLFLLLDSMCLPYQIIECFRMNVMMKWNSSPTSTTNNIPSKIVEIVGFLKNQKSTKNVVKKWGQEAIKWACGCGDLIIAKKSTIVFSIICKPFNELVLDGILNNIKILTNCKETLPSKEYLIILLQCLNNIIDKYSMNHKFEPLFRKIFLTSICFVTYFESQSIVYQSVTIVAKYIKDGKPQEEDVHLFYRALAEISANNPQMAYVDCAFLSFFVMKTPLKKHQSDLIHSVFLLYLPRIFIAYAAYYNIEPYSSALKDDDIINIIQTALQMAKSGLINSEISNYMHNEIMESMKTPYYSFFTSLSDYLIRKIPRKLIEVSPHLINMSRSKFPYFQKSVLAFIASLLSNSEFSQGADVFSMMAEFLSSINLPESEEILRMLLAASSQEPQPISINLIETPETLWKHISEKLQALNNNLTINDKKYLQYLLPILPINKEIWNDMMTSGNKVISILLKSYENFNIEPYSSNKKYFGYLKQEPQRIDLEIGF